MPFNTEPSCSGVCQAGSNLTDSDSGIHKWDKHKSGLSVLEVRLLFEIILNWTELVVPVLSKTNSRHGKLATNS